MVEEVECIHAELEVEPFGELPGLLDREIVTDESRPSTIAQGLIAQGSDLLADRAECCWIVDLRSLSSLGAACAGDERTPVGTMIPRRSFIASAVQAVQCSSPRSLRIHQESSVFRQARRVKRGRWSRLRREDGRSLPATKGMSQEGIDASEFGQRHNHIGHENVWPVDLRIAPIQARILSPR